MSRLKTLSDKVLLDSYIVSLRLNLDPTFREILLCDIKECKKNIPSLLVSS
ncbi:hypothetical protein [Halalkalibacter urbisdiaboli]|uniref:hypothetical protein n=1 Tax=Halalkalibacter urbisdiaboli TaxID=1960589 RepID=UPI0013FDDA2E|nr:hypothetical protein [Halalkalibacter urbisdiaboli]